MFHQAFTKLSVSFYLNNICETWTLSMLIPFLEDWKAYTQFLNIPKTYSSGKLPTLCFWNIYQRNSHTIFWKIFLNISKVVVHLLRALTSMKEYFLDTDKFF